MKSDKPVKGELYEVNKDKLLMLDYLEGHPDFYKRELIDVFDENGRKISDVWAYVFPKNDLNLNDLKKVYEYDV